MGSLCVCVCVNKQGTWEHTNEKRQISWIKSVYDTMRIRGLFTDYFKCTSAYIGFWFQSIGIIHETHNWSVEAANKAILCPELQPFKPCRCNFIGSQFSSWSLYRPLPGRKSRKHFCQKYRSMTFFLSFFFLDSASFSHQHIGHNFANTKDKGQFK